VLGVPQNLDLQFQGPVSDGSEKNFCDVYNWKL